MLIEYKGVKPKHILMKVTSRNRPEQLIKCIKAYLELAVDTTAMTWLISLDTDDDKCNSLGFIDSIRTIINEPTIVFGASYNKIHAINRDVDYVKEWDILLNISDDQTPCVRGYDEIIRDSMPNDLDASLWFYDGAQPRINTMEIQGRNYYNRLGYIYNPIYKSFYCDNEATEVAYNLEKLIKSSQCIIRHDHPACHHATSLKHDALYERNQTYWNADQETFYKRRANNYK